MVHLSAESVRTRVRENDVDVRRQRLAERYSMWEPTSLSQHFERCAQSWPDRPFIVVGSESATYAQFYDCVLAIAGRLAAMGVSRLDHVGVMLGNSVDFFATKIAVARLGARALAVNYLLKESEVEFILRASECSTLIYEPVIIDIDVVKVLNAVTASLGEDTSLKRFVHVDSADGLSETIAMFESVHMDSLPGLAPVPDGSSPDDIAEIMFTSGSSGEPKGVQVRTHNFLGEGYGTAWTRALDDGWTSITALPPFHVMGYIEAVLPVSFVGGCIVLQRKFDPDAQLSAVRTYGIDDCVAVPAMTARLVKRAQAGHPDLSTLRAVFSAGNAVSAESWEHLKRVLGVSEITTAYGLTEAAGTVAMVGPDDSMDLLTNTVGKLKYQGAAGIPELDGQRFYVRIVDHESGEPVAPGEAGEIQLRGPSVMPGYWKLPQQTALAFQDGWLRTGDRGLIREDGALVLTGRIKELYRSGGELVSPREVEDVLCQHPGIDQAYVVGIPDDHWGEIGCAYIVRSPGSEITADEVTSHVRATLARYKVPRRVFFIGADEVPTGGSGKVQKRSFAERAVVDASIATDADGAVLES